eukprot:365328-Chlamydomonas_euryale.AAC.12
MHMHSVSHLEEAAFEEEQLCRHKAVLAAGLDHRQACVPQRQAVPLIKVRVKPANLPRSRRRRRAIARRRQPVLRLHALDRLEKPAEVGLAGQPVAPQLLVRDPQEVCYEAHERLRPHVRACCRVQRQAQPECRAERHGVPEADGGVGAEPEAHARRAERLAAVGEERGRAARHEVRRTGDCLAHDDVDVLEHVAREQRRAAAGAAAQHVGEAGHQVQRPVHQLPREHERAASPVGQLRAAARWIQLASCQQRVAAVVRKLRGAGAALRMGAGFLGQRGGSGLSIMWRPSRAE